MHGWYSVPGINCRKQWFLCLGLSHSLSSIAWHPRRLCLRKSIILRPRRIRKWPSSNHCKSKAQECSFIVLMISAFAHLCTLRLSYNGYGVKCPRIVMEINALLFDMNSIELLLLKIKPNNGKDLWWIFIEMACDSDQTIDNEAVIANSCDGHIDLWTLP